MRASSLLFVVLLTLPLTLSAGDKKDNLDGTWNLESVVINGNKTDSEKLKKAYATVEKDVVTLKVGDTVVKKAIFTYDATKSPKTMDVTAEDKDGKKVTTKCVYKLEGDVLTICIAQPGKDRPTDFTCKEGSDRELVTYRRKK